MLSMLKRHEIQTLARAQLSYDRIVELTGVPRRTVARVIQEDPVTEIDDESARKELGIGRPSKVDPFRKMVRKVLEEEPALLSVEILRRMKLEGYQGQKSAMYALIKDLRPPRSDLVTRFEGLPGEFTQHDFGEVTIRYLDGTVEKVLFFASRLKYSRWVQVSLVPNQKAETLVRTTCEHFCAIGGLPLLAVFDRPKTVALEWKKDGTITRYNPVFSQAMMDMGVGPEVCWPHAPRQKGSVENLVGWVKGSFFKVRRFQDRADLEAQLVAWHQEANVERPSRATGVPPVERIEAELARMRPVKVRPEELAVRIPVFCGPTAMVSLEGSLYSMPPEAASFAGTAFLYPTRVHIEAGRFSSEHDRATEPGTRSVLPEHRSARLAKVSGRRGKQYLKRQDLLDLGDVAMTLIGEIVHRRPQAWWQEIDALHELLDTFGDGALKLAMYSAVAGNNFSADAVMSQLVAATIGGERRPSC